MAGYKVSAVKVKDDALRAAARRSVELLGGMGAFVSPGDRVVIKPNMFINVGPETGKITHPALVLEVAHMAREAGAEKVIVAERNFAYHDIFKGFEEIYDIAEVVNLDEAPHRLVTIPGARNLRHPIPVPRLIDEIDVFISCPGLRTHGLSYFSNGLKNIMGILPGWNVLHVHGYGLEESYLDLDRYRPSDLVVTDAFIAVEGNFPAEGDPRPLNFVFAADNPLASDFAACRLLGLTPQETPVMAEAVARGLGPGSMEEIEFLGDPLEPPSEPIVRPPSDLTSFTRDFELVMEGDCYGCRGALAGGLTLVRNAAPELYERAAGCVRIITGPDPRVNDSPFNLFYGTCANRPRKEMPARGQGLYIPGCPPLAGFLRSELAVATRRPRAFISDREIKIHGVDEILVSGFDDGFNVVAPDSSETRAACQEVRRFLNESQDVRDKDWRVIVLSRNGLSSSRGLRFLERLSQEAALAGETKQKNWSMHFQVGLDLPYLQDKEGLSARAAEQLVRRMAFACGVILLPETADEALLSALIEEHYGGVVLCKGNPIHVEKAYGDLYEKLVAHLR